LTAVQLWPALVSHFTVHTPQLVTLVVSTASPPQQRALSSPGFHCVPSVNGVDFPQTPAVQDGTLWQTSSGMPHGVPSALT
jgi:hypothetical protein